MAKKNYYAVKSGKIPGIYRSWSECEVQVKCYPGAVYKGFVTEKEAKAYLNNESKAVSADVPTSADVPW